MTEQQVTESRKRQILVGVAILCAVAVGFTSLLLFWRQIPGWVGESVGMVVGIMSTPFFMEASFVILGIIIVVGLNTWRRHKEGDEFVTMEEKDDGDGGSPPGR
jgi:hypothetical protein